MNFEPIKGAIARNRSTGQLQTSQQRRTASDTNPRPQTHVIRYMALTKRGLGHATCGVLALGETDEKKAMKRLHSVLIGQAGYCNLEGCAGYPERQQRKK